MKTFKEKVFLIVKKIPKGKTITYKEVACRAGSPRAWRAAGNILKKNYDSAVPCHRVIRSDGTPGGYNRGGAKEKAILIAEKFAKEQMSLPTYQFKEYNKRIAG